MSVSYRQIRDAVERERCRIVGSHIAARALAQALREQGCDAVPPDETCHAVTVQAMEAAVRLVDRVISDAQLRARLKELAGL